MQLVDPGVDDTHTYDLPLPPSLSSSRIERRLTLTLAWLTPTNPRHRGYRRAALSLGYATGSSATFGNRQEVDSHAAGRGTLQHEVLISRRAVPFGPGEITALEVSCRAAAGELIDSVPYALLATIETPVESRPSDLRGDTSGDQVARQCASCLIVMVSPPAELIRGQPSLL